MASRTLGFVSVITLFCIVSAQHTAIDVIQDMYYTCLKGFSVSCVKPKALSWITNIANDPVIRITDDLAIVKKDNPEEREETRSIHEDVLDKFETFLQTHDLVAKVPEFLRPEGPLGNLIPRSFQPDDVTVPLAATGRSKAVKKIIVPFLLGLKFKTAVLVPLALALIALKTWKALTLGLLSLVLTGAMLIFKLSKPKVTTYEVVHYPQHYEHHVEHAAPAAAAGWDTGYGRSGQEQAYQGWLN
ncbi:hypothetical protein MML48_5g00010395 [Holotrichia oblita]|uniref:Uncharacterized protein n=2 Tax=Holotrichia oblita TaxID=644536 RepID=A0ACB9T4H8_HOLOL|nr:hypothetical protein MML48_5g00002981 [Holotrichia oblita]KAI4461719.1 hypothetical protein MML48_5g00010395 [Holotrichia oblita]